MFSCRLTTSLAARRCIPGVIRKAALAIGLLAVIPAALCGQSAAVEDRADHTLMIGWADTDITPEGPVHLTGLGRAARITDKVKDPIQATVLALESVAPDRPGRAVLVSLDLLSASECIRDKVREHLRQELPELPPQLVFFFATHTHTAPFHYTRPRYQPDFEQTDEPWIFRRHNDEAFRKAREAMPPLTCRQYVSFASRRIADGVKKAWTERAPGGIAFGLGHAVVGRNRLVVDRKGNGRMYGQTNTPDFSHVQGYEDHSINFLATYLPDGTLSGLVVNIACPAQAETSGRQVSADFWHDTRAELRRRFGDGLFILPQVSAAGDQDTNELFESAAARRMARLAGRTSRQEIAVRIADAADRVLPLIRSEIDWRPAFVHHVEILELPRLLRPALPMYEGRPTGARTHGHSRPNRRTLAAPESKNTQPDNPTLPVEVHALRLGAVGMVTNPFELFLDYAIRIKGRSPAIQTFVVQLAGPGSYLPSARAIKSGGYGATSGSREVSPEGGDKLVDWCVDTLNACWQ